MVLDIIITSTIVQCKSVSQTAVETGFISSSAGGYDSGLILWFCLTHCKFVTCYAVMERVGDLIIIIIII